MRDEKKVSNLNKNDLVPIYNIAIVSIIGGLGDSKYQASLITEGGPRKMMCSSERYAIVHLSQNRIFFSYW
jgi:hypothetical protein